MMKETVQDTLQEHEEKINYLVERVRILNHTVQRLNREQITPVSEASAQAKEVLG